MKEDQQDRMFFLFLKITAAIATAVIICCTIEIVLINF